MTRGHRLVQYAVAVVALVAVTVWALVTRSPRTAESSRHVYFVAPDGSDSGDGTMDAPWRTLQKAADSVGSGSTVYVRGGVYRQTVAIHVSGSSSGGFISFRNYPGEHPVLDGAGLSVPNGLNGMVSIDSRDYLTVQGFEIRDYRTAEPGHVPIGIYVTGDASHIRILDNVVHDIQTNVQMRHAPSRIEYRLGGKCSAFVADVGIDDEVENQGSVVFQVWGDGQRLYDSGILRGVDGATPAYADLSGVGMLELVVTGAGDGIGNDHADWAGARVACG